MLVLKIGGSSLATPQHIQSRAKQITALHNSGESLIVVVSAMGNSTDELNQLAYKVSHSPQQRELDMLLSSGERISMALLSMALNDLNCPAISFTGSQAGVLTESDHNNAQIKALKPIRVEQELSKNKVVIIAGFQGVDPITKEVTTLGRGGSDTTAVAFANHFKADCCYMLKDVNGVYNCDPNIFNNSCKIPELNYQQMLEICEGGAQVLHARSVITAQKLSTKIRISLADDISQFTEIHSKANFNKNFLIAINSRPLNSKNDLLTLTFSQPISSNSFEIIKKYLDDFDSFDTISREFSLVLTVPIQRLASIKNHLLIQLNK